MPITDEWIVQKLNSKRKINRFRYKVKGRREDLKEKKWVIDIKSLMNERLNNIGERSTP